MMHRLICILGVASGAWLGCGWPNAGIAQVPEANEPNEPNEASRRLLRTAESLQLRKMLEADPRRLRYAGAAQSGREGDVHFYCRVGDEMRSLTGAELRAVYVELSRETLARHARLHELAEHEFRKLELALIVASVQLERQLKRAELEFRTARGAKELPCEPALRRHLETPIDAEGATYRKVLTTILRDREQRTLSQPNR